MNKDNILIGVLIEDNTTSSFLEVCQKYNISDALLVDMIEQGLFANQPNEPDKISFDQKALRRLESAFRLHRDLEINLQGVALALDLLDEIEQMHRELDVLRRHF